MPPKRPAGLALSPAFDPDKLKAFDDHDEYHPPVKSAADALPISSIIEGRVYIGSVKDLANLAGLRAMGITHILNVAREVETVPEQKPSPVSAAAAAGAASNSNGAAGEVEVLGDMKLVASSGEILKDGCGCGDGTMGEPEQSFTAKLSGDVSHFEWHHISLRDGVNKDTAGGIDAAVAYLERAVKSGGTVLVHCRRGISRSAAVVVAYLMRHGLSLDTQEPMLYTDAAAYVKSKRSVVSLNLEFRMVLEQRCEERRASPSSSGVKPAAAAAAAGSGEAAGFAQQAGQAGDEGSSSSSSSGAAVKKEGAGFGGEDAGRNGEASAKASQQNRVGDDSA